MNWKRFWRCFCFEFNASERWGIRIFLMCPWFALEAAALGYDMMRSKKWSGLVLSSGHVRGWNKIEGESYFRRETRLVRYHRRMTSGGAR